MRRSQWLPPAYRWIETSIEKLVINMRMRLQLLEFNILFHVY